MENLKSSILSTTDITAVMLILIAFLLMRLLAARLSSLSKLPPGPSILTRILDGQNNEPMAIKFKRWSHVYGNVISIMDFVHLREPTIVLNTPRAAIDLLDKRGSIYSSRPRNILAGEICFRGFKGTLQPSGERFRRFRTIMTTTLGVDASKRFRLLEDQENRLLLRDLVLESDSDKHRPLIQRALHSVAFCTAFGQRVDRLGPRHAAWFANSERFFQEYLLPGRHLVDHFPILLRLPKFLQWFRKRADEQGKREEQFFLNCFDRAKEAIDRGQNTPGAIVCSREKQQKYGWTDREIAITLSSPYSAGVTTTLGSMDSFIWAILLNPRVMKKAQAEIDSVVGDDRMPGFEDSDSLPYVRAIIKETLRYNIFDSWHPFLPLGIAHATTKDDIYEGMLIPAGGTVIANIYAITRNTELFPEPEEFKPERFIDNPDPMFKNFNLTFGFGRRICAGQHIATDQLFLFISRLLWAFDIIPLENTSANLPSHQIPVHGRPGPSVPPPYTLVARGEHTRSMIIERAIMAEKEVKTWECTSFD